MTVAPPVSSATVALSGDLDIATAPATHRALVAALDGGAFLTVDMSAVRFIDATGIGVLLIAANLAREVGGGLVLQAPPWQVQRIVRILHLDRLLPAVG